MITSNGLKQIVSDDSLLFLGGKMSNYMNYPTQVKISNYVKLIIAYVILTLRKILTNIESWKRKNNSK